MIILSTFLFLNPRSDVCANLIMLSHSYFKKKKKMLSHSKILHKYDRHFLISYHDWEFKENEVTDYMMKEVNPFFFLLTWKWVP